MVRGQYMHMVAIDEATATKSSNSNAQPQKGHHADLVRFGFHGTERRSASTMPVAFALRLSCGVSFVRVPSASITGSSV
eukprot:7058030-Alexandrium_andersonii.AAC.1